MEEKLASVYGLKDRRNDEIFYIGMSTDPYSRYGEHIAVRRSTSPKSKRILDMRKDGLMPELIIFEQNIELSNALNREQYWIEHHLALGTPLTNIQRTRGREREPKEPTIEPVKPIHHGNRYSNKYGHFISVYEVRKTLQPYTEEHNLEKYTRKVTRFAEKCRDKYGALLYLKEDVLTCMGMLIEKGELKSSKHQEQPLQ